jgi:phage gp29-like protein
MLRTTRTAANPIVAKIIRPQRLELASIKGGRDVTRPYFGKMLEPLDSVLAGQGRDYQVYEELLKDSQVHSCFQQLSDRISECETTVLPGGERPIDLAAAEAFELVLKAIGWDEITKRMAYARIFGFSVAEVLWGIGGTIECIKVRAQRRFKFDEDLNLRLLTMTNSYEGELLPDRKFWHLSMGGWRSDEPYGLGLGHQLYWPVYFKKNGVLSWLRFLEKYGHPLPLVRHAEGATDDQKREAIYLAQSLAEDSAAAGSENLTFDLIESSRNGTADYTQLVQTMDAQIAKIILSQGMTTDNGSSRAQADVHNGVADSIVKSLSDLICESFNKSIVTWWCEFNFPGAKPPQVWRRTEPESDLVAIVARDKTLWEMGFPPTAEYIVETYGEGFRPPERGEDAPIALNGAQVTALTTTISQAISDGWIPELAVATIRASFPTIGADLITAIAQQLQAQVDKSAELAKPQEAIVSPDVAAAQFSETLDYADELATIAENVLGSITEYARSPDFSNELASAIKRTSRLLTSGDFAESPLDDRDDLEILADRVRSIDPMKPWLESLSEGLDGIGNLADFAEYLTNAWDKLDPKEFRDRMAEAVTIASMAGYMEAGADGTN